MGRESRWPEDGVAHDPPAGCTGHVAVRLPCVRRDLPALPRGAAHHQRQLVAGCDHCPVMIDPESVRLGFEVEGNGRTTQFLVQLVVEEAVVTEIVGPAIRRFAPIPDPECATPRRGSLRS
jgi:hypothetical protein